MPIYLIKLPNFHRIKTKRRKQTLFLQKSKTPLHADCWFERAWVNLIWCNPSRSVHPSVVRVKGEKARTVKGHQKMGGKKCKEKKVRKSLNRGIIEI